jgi:hypothetical protein
MPDEQGVNIVLLCADGFVYLIKPDGQMVWRCRVGTSARSIDICDLTRDGKPEILVGGEIEDSNHPFALALGDDGLVRWSMPTLSPIPYIKALHPNGHTAYLFLADQENILRTF